MKLPAGKSSQTVCMQEKRSIRCPVRGQYVVAYQPCGSSNAALKAPFHTGLKTLCLWVFTALMRHKVHLESQLLMTGSLAVTRGTELAESWHCKLPSMESMMLPNNLNPPCSSSPSSGLNSSERPEVLPHLHYNLVSSYVLVLNWVNLVSSDVSSWWAGVSMGLDNP